MSEDVVSAVANAEIHPPDLIDPERSITGMSAILLPFTTNGSVDWQSFTHHVARTVEAGLTPAVNMDTGYANLIDEETRREVLRRTRDTVGDDSFVAGAFVQDEEGDAFNPDAYREQIEQIERYDGTPIIFQSYGLTGQPGPEIAKSYARMGEWCDEFIAFELGKMFAPFGKIYSLNTYARLLDISSCIGAKHSSLNRELEWRRLLLRNEVRSDFMVLTGNDLAIDMVMYGSDYLLGLSTFAPDLFGKRDRLWEQGDSDFYELNDLLQYLGFFAFREPVPAYKHSAAQFLQMRDWISSSKPHPQGETRPESDLAILRDIGERLGVLEE